VIRRAALLAACLAAPSAHAETLTLALSSDKVTIASNFAGGDLTVFGAVRGAPADSGRYDLVITTRGPSRTLTVREKAPVAGFWFVRSSRDYPGAPSFLDVQSTRPLGDATEAADREQNRLGLYRNVPGDIADPASAALVRIQESRGLWREDPQGVTFLDPALFRATVRLPPNVPFGTFEVEARLYRQKTLVARAVAPFRVAKAGFEARVADVAERIRFGYGLAAAGLSLLFGWAASAIFRRD
jgi:uncharacterized protein (TIGR02186 family)